MELAMELIEKGKIQILKGNISELLAIAGQPFHGTGIDAGVEDAMTGDNEEERKEIFRRVSKKTGVVLLATVQDTCWVDQVDVSSWKMVCRSFAITGTGCMVGALSAAFLAQRDPFSAALLGTSVWELLGTLLREVRVPGSFQMELLDAVAGMTQDELEARIRIREIGI